MTFFEDLDCFIHWYTSSQHAIITDSIMIWLVPKVHSAFLDELFLICPWWYMSYNQKVQNIRLPGVGVRYLEKRIILEKVVNGQILCIFELHFR
jgi:hypothetical protein